MDDKPFEELTPEELAEIDDFNDAVTQRLPENSIMLDDGRLVSLEDDGLDTGLDAAL